MGGSCRANRHNHTFAIQSSSPNPDSSRPLAHGGVMGECPAPLRRCSRAVTGGSAAGMPRPSREISQIPLLRRAEDRFGIGSNPPRKGRREGQLRQRDPSRARSYGAIIGAEQGTPAIHLAAILIAIQQSDREARQLQLPRIWPRT